jgi:hypothetical protein
VDQKVSILCSFYKRQIICREKTQCPDNLIGHLTFGGYNDKLCNTTALPVRYLKMEPKGTKWTVKLDK